MVSSESVQWGHLLKNLCTQNLYSEKAVGGSVALSSWPSKCRPAKYELSDLDTRLVKVVARRRAQSLIKSPFYRLIFITNIYLVMYELALFNCLLVLPIGQWKNAE